MNFIKRSASVFLALFVTATVVFSQDGRQQKTATPDSVSDKELEQFANVADSARSIQQEVESKVQTLVEDEGMKFTRFQQIMMSKQDPDAPGQVKATKKEEETIQKIQPQLMQINQQAQQQFVQVIQDEGLSTQRFQEIMRAIQTDPRLQQRLEEVRNKS